MFSRIHDTVGRSLLLLFLIKPTIDLTWWLTVPVAGRAVGPMHLFSGLLFFYLLQFRLRPSAVTPPALRLFEAFLGLHVIALLVGIGTNDRLTLMAVVDFMLRICDSYLIYFCAFLAAMRYRYRDVMPFVKAIVIGASIVILANAIAVPLDIHFGGPRLGVSAEQEAFREKGLYYDAGVLANVAFFHLVFSVFLLHLTPWRGRLLGVVALLGLILIDLWLIANTHSRSPILQLAIFGFIYLLIFQKGLGKLMAPVAASIVIGLAVVLFDIDLDELFLRFESERVALEGDAEVGFTAGGDISFGSLETLGSNRGALWASAMTQVLKRSGIEILFGNFTGTIAHSDYIDILSRSGLISLLVYLALLVSLVLRCWSAGKNARSPHDRAISYMAFTLVICYLAYSMPFRPIAYTTTSWYMWAMIAFAMARARLAPAEAAAAAKARDERATPPTPDAPEEDPGVDDPERAPAASWRRQRRGAI